MTENKSIPLISSTVDNSQYSLESKPIFCDYDDDDEPMSMTHLPLQQPSILYNNNNNNNNTSQPTAQSEEQYILLNDNEENSPYLFDATLALSVPIQRVNSEDDFDMYVKRKRAKFVGPYLFGDVIGQGSYAKVKECLDRRNLCRRAVKIMQRRRLRKTPHGEEMAATEIRLLKKLNHPNVIKLYDFIRNDEKQKLYLFIDLCVVSLQEMLDADDHQREFKGFPKWQAHSYFIQLINGLEYLHSKFIIHNDIKPGNLLITIDHQLKITDFGTAEQLDLFSSDDTIKRSQGTPAFQCPEIANGEDSYSGFSIDVWSCGVTLYNLVTGRLPFEADNIYLLFQTIGKGVYTIPEDLEPNLTSLIHGLLNINKNLRFTIEQIKQHDWFRRRPPRTFEFVPFPHLALNRFHKLTMSDYLTELHRSSELSNDNQKEEQINMSKDSNPCINSPHEYQYNQPKQENTDRSTLNCSCSRTISNENMNQNTTRTRNRPRICTIS